MKKDFNFLGKTEMKRLFSIENDIKKGIINSNADLNDMAHFVIQRNSKMGSGLFRSILDETAHRERIILKKHFKNLLVKP
jgi:hypothetical protein